MNIYFRQVPVFSNKNIAIADMNDVTVIKKLLDSAYRGESSRDGWTSESHIIAGETRTDQATMQKLILQTGSIFLKYTNEKNEIIGCVNLQEYNYKIYLGMLSVSPKLQGGGIGKEILQASEEYAKHLKCASIYMSVISVRTELINWYKRHGYKETGERKPFIEDKISGKHLQPLEFMMLEKIIL